MKLWVKYILFGVLTYFLFLVVRLPASVAYSWAAEKVQPAELSSIDGSIWSGHAAEFSYQGTELGELEWRFSPSALFGARLGFSFMLSGPQIHTEGEAGITVSGTPYFSPLDGAMDARLLGSILRFNLGKIKGDLEYQLENLELSHDGHVISAFGDILWKEAAIVQPVDLELGEVEISLATDNGDIIIDFSGEGALTVDGQTVIEPDGRFTVNGLVLPQPSAPEEVVATLRSFGRETPDGKIELEYTGRL